VHSALVVQALSSLGFGTLADELFGKDIWLANESENVLIVNAVSDVWGVDFNRYVLQDFQVGLRDIEPLTLDSAAILRREVIRIRENFKGNHYYKEAIVMSHVLAWLAALQSHMALDHG
jgi:hypothetical protein